MHKLQVSWKHSPAKMKIDYKWFGEIIDTFGWLILRDWNQEMIKANPPFPEIGYKTSNWTKY